SASANWSGAPCTFQSMGERHAERDDLSRVESHAPHHGYLPFAHHRLEDGGVNQWARYARLDDRAQPGLRVPSSRRGARREFAPFALGAGLWHHIKRGSLCGTTHAARLTFRRTRGKSYAKQFAVFAALRRLSRVCFLLTHGGTRTSLIFGRGGA